MQITNTNKPYNTKIKMLIYGPPGAGKTRLAATLPQEKTLLLSAEAGLLCLQDKNIDVVDLTTNDAGDVLPEKERFKRLRDVFYKLVSEKQYQEKYDWIFVDSLTEISMNMFAELQELFPNRKDSFVLYNENFKRMTQLIKSFRDMKHYNVVFTALSSTEIDDNGFRTEVVNLIGRKTIDLVPAYFDEVFYLAVVSDEKTKARRRYLCTQKTERTVCKDRSGKLDPYSNPNLSEIVEKIRGKNET